MPDARIIEMLNCRDEHAIHEMDAEYGPLLKKVIRQIIITPEDTEECLNDTYFNMWNSIPPASPKNLRAYICKAARNLALDRCKYESRKKRQTPSTEEIAAEFSDVVVNDWADPLVDQLAFDHSLNQFLRGLSAKHRMVFLRRYWLMMGCEEIAADMGISINTVKTILSRTRHNLKEHLDREGLTV